MRAIRVNTLDGPDAAQVEQVAEPGASTTGVLVEVHAAGVAFPELLLTRGRYQLRPELPFTPGSEVAGTVVAAPPGSGFRAGDRVAGYLPWGGWAERVVLDPALTFPLPAAVDFVTAAGVPMNYLTAHFALTRRGRLQPDERVLVHGAAGGVGTAAVQLARVLGAEVIAVASSSHKQEVARAAGAQHVIGPDGFLDAVRGLTGGRGVDVVVDPVGGDRMTDSLRSLGPEGRLLVVGFAAGEVPTVRVNRLLLGNAAVVGVGWGAFCEVEPTYAATQWLELSAHLETGRLAPVVERRYPLTGASEALRALDDRSGAGKIVLEVR
jgi:NADPH:quinone reductase